MSLHNFGFVIPKFLRCAQPDDSGLVSLARDLNVDTIISLNGAEDAAFSGNHLIYDLPTFTVDLGQIRSILGEIAVCLQSGQTVCVHCTHGRDRTGLVVGAWRLKYGRWTLDEVNAERAIYGVYGIVEMADAAINEALETLSQEAP